VTSLKLPRGDAEFIGGNETRSFVGGVADCLGHWAMKPLAGLVLAGVFLASVLLTTQAATASGDQNLAIIVNANVAVSRLSASELEAIFTSSRRTWPDGSSIGAFSYALESQIRRDFDRVVLRMSTDEVARFWIDQRVRGGAPPPRQVPDPSLVIRLVAKLPGCIAYVPDNLVNPTVKVVARVRDGRVIAP
jgi:hypothetical protein